MLRLVLLVVSLGQDPSVSGAGRRPEPPMTEEQRAEDALNQPSEGERAATDGRTPDRLICDLRRIPGSNLRQRVCSTVADRRRTRAEAQSVLSGVGVPTSAN